jgi:Chaperone of endosialidase
MPRDGSSIYSIPPGTEGVPNTTIESLRYNVFLQDITQDLNTPRPIVMGGTGANNATTAADNLGAEKSRQVVTNFDSHQFISGSFYCATTAIGTPVAGHRFIGVVAQQDNNNMVLVATDLDATPQPDVSWTRTRVAGTWSAWVQTVAPGLSGKVSKAGDTMTGDLIFDKTGLTGTTGATNRIWGKRNTVNRWEIDLGNGGTETGNNTGTDFVINRYSDAGALIDTPFKILRGGTLKYTQVDDHLRVGALAVMPASATIDEKAVWSRRVYLSPGSVGNINIGFNCYNEGPGGFKGLQTANSAGVIQHRGSDGVFGLYTGGAVLAGGAVTFTSNFTISPSGLMITNCQVYKPGGGMWGDNSDARIKHNIVDYEAGLGEILQLRPRTFSFVKQTWRNAKKRYIGLVAQECENVMPEMVSRQTEPLGDLQFDDMRTLDATPVIYALINAVKTLSARIDAMERRQR